MTEQTFEQWKEKFKKEKAKIQEELKSTNRFMPDEKVEYFARVRVGPPPDNGWKR